MNDEQMMLILLCCAFLALSAFTVFAATVGSTPTAIKELISANNSVINLLDDDLQ